MQNSEAPAPEQQVYQGFFHAERVASIVNDLALPRNKKLSKAVKRMFISNLEMLDQAWQVNGVDFSRIQFEELLQARDSGKLVEFESFSPYLLDYIDSDGHLTVDDLIAEDLTGLQVAGMLRQFFPKARLISLYDEYNTQKYQADGVSNEQPREFTEQERRGFREDIIRLLQAVNAIPEHAHEGSDFILVAESEQVKHAALMIKLLDQKGLIERRGEEIWFVNSLAENPLYQNIPLRTKWGHWRCEALDAAAFLKPENQDITHLVVLPSYMKSQQDKMWEIIKILNIPTRNYHNIFYDPSLHPSEVCQVVAAMLGQAEIQHMQTNDNPISTALPSLG